jgi:hypothetical protein
VYILTYQYELQNDVSGSQLADVSGLHELEETNCVLSCIMSAGLMETVSVFASSAPEAELPGGSQPFDRRLAGASYKQTRCH